MGPSDPVPVHGLPLAGKESGTVLLGELQLLGERLVGIADRYALAMTRKISKQGIDEVLKRWNLIALSVQQFSADRPSGNGRAIQLPPGVCMRND